jgi:hypothetical protein
LPALRNRIPPRRLLLLAFTACMVPLQLWTWVIFLYKVPSYLLSMRLGQVFAILCYMQVSALIESLLLWLIVSLLAYILPRRFYLDWYVPQTVILITALICWAIGTQFMLISQQNESVAGSGLSTQTLWTVGWLVACLAAALALRFVKPMSAFLTALADRLTVLAFAFLAFDLLGAGVVLVRNLIGWITA